jgi:hypothetical protein
MKKEDAELDHVLRQWQCPDVQTASVERQVWQTIAVREDSPGWSGEVGAIGWKQSWLGAAMAASLGLAAIVAGIGAAEWRIQSGRDVSSVQSPGQAYFESINPVALARHEHR